MIIAGCLCSIVSVLSCVAACCISCGLSTVVINEELLLLLVVVVQKMFFQSLECCILMKSWTRLDNQSLVRQISQSLDFCITLTTFAPSTAPGWGRPSQKASVMALHSATEGAKTAITQLHVPLPPSFSE